MKNRAQIVIGLGFGDEGKGLATDYLCRLAERPLVIRFNGGQQAGHTVCLPGGRRHVFSHFGAGTLRGAATYWSAYCTFSLPHLLNEYKALLQNEVAPQLYLDEACAITTHYDVLYNRLQEGAREGNRHGSCGMGFGATLQREEDGIHFCVKDLLDTDVCYKRLAAIRAYYVQKARAQLSIDFNAFDHDREDSRFFDYLAKFGAQLHQSFFITTAQEVFASKQWQHYVFEGAQGILLDMDFGCFPHVTRSHTTSKNAMEIISRNKGNISDVEIFYVSRAYHTRHGEGPFVQERKDFYLTNNDKETNVFNNYQGSFRTGPLDINQVQYALQADDTYSKGIAKNLLLTCLDQVDENAIPHTYNGKTFTTDSCGLIERLQQNFNKILLSHSPYAERIKQITNVKAMA